MRAFYFRLQRVLDWESRVCQLEQQRLGEAKLAVDATETRISELTRSSARAEQESLSRPELSAADVVALAAHRTQVARNRRALEERKGAEVAAVQQQTAVVSMSRQRVRAMENLRERAFQEHTRAAETDIAATALTSHLSKLVRERQLTRDRS